MQSDPCERILLEFIEPHDVADLASSKRVTNEQKCLLYCFVYAAIKAGIEMPRIDPRLEPIPAALTANQEDEIIEFCGSREMHIGSWIGMGPKFLMAGLATMLMDMSSNARRGHESYMKLAEQLYPGITSLAGYAKWRGHHLVSFTFPERLRVRMGFPRR